MSKLTILNLNDNTAIVNTNQYNICKINEDINDSNRAKDGTIDNKVDEFKRKKHSASERLHINCMYTNTRSPMNNNKREELKILLRDKSIDLLGITESWAHDGIDDSELTFEGYVMFRKDRKNPLKERGGGVILCVKEFLCAVMMLDDTIYPCESL